LRRPLAHVIDYRDQRKSVSTLEHAQNPRSAHQPERHICDEQLPKPHHT
jgi:hypothetical protein